MCIFKRPSAAATPTVTQVAEPVQVEPVKSASETTTGSAASNLRAKALALRGLSGTRVTGPLGLTNAASTAQKTLLGQ